MRRILVFVFALTYICFSSDYVYGQKKKTLDQTINDIFGPISAAISDLIFYAPKLYDDILYREVGVFRSENHFYEAPPIQLTYHKDNNLIPYGHPIRVGYAAEDSFLLRGVIGGQEVNRILPYDQQTFLVEGFRFALIYDRDSPYKIEPGRAYSFQIIEVRFLPLVVLVLIGGAIFFTLYFGFINITKFGLAISILRAKYNACRRVGEISRFQALCMALAGTVGVGNIAGVAIAISIGGAGATFWMVLAGFLSMATKFTECTLGIKYRQIGIDGIISGGPMYYLSQGLANQGYRKMGKIFAGFFAIMCIGGSLGVGNMFQVNQACQQLISVSGGAESLVAQYTWVFGLLIAALIAVVIIGDIRRIAVVTDKLVPLMCGLYIIAALWIISMHIVELPAVLEEIVSGAFAPMSVAGGFIGVLLQGFRRAAFSNEAGLGSSAIAHATVKTNNPASQGMVALLEPFIDTVIVCSLTALVIIITGKHTNPLASDGILVASAAFKGEIPFSDYFLTVAVILFAFSTMLSWSYYGLKAWIYLVGNHKKSNIIYQVLFCLFAMLGSVATLTSITDFSDAMIFAMTFPNMIGLVVLAPEVRAELTKYMTKIQRGEFSRK